MRIALSYVEQKLHEASLKQKDDPIWTILRDDLSGYLANQFRCGINTLEETIRAAEYSTVLRNLPKSQIIVLIFTYKKACRTSTFNFEAVFQFYGGYMTTHKNQIPAT